MRTKVFIQTIIVQPIPPYFASETWVLTYRAPEDIRVKAPEAEPGHGSEESQP